MNGSPEITLTLMNEAKSIPGLCKLPHDNHEAGHHVMWCGGEHHRTRVVILRRWKGLDPVGSMEGLDQTLCNESAFFLNKLS